VEQPDITDAQHVLALQVAREWQQVLGTLAEDAIESLETVKDVELRVTEGHPYFWGKLSMLRTLRGMADEDVKRFSAGAKWLEHYRQLELELRNVISHYQAQADDMDCSAGNWDGGSSATCEHCALLGTVEHLTRVLERRY
jgi:hypothetical protein